MAKSKFSQLIARTSWDDEDEAAFYAGLKRRKSPGDVAYVMDQKAKNLEQSHPDIAARLYRERLNINAGNSLDAAIRLANLEIGFGNPAQAYKIFDEILHAHFSPGGPVFYASRFAQLLSFAAEHAYEENYPHRLDRADTIDLSLLGPRNDHGATFRIYAACAFMADALHQAERSQAYLEQAKAAHTNPHWQGLSGWQFWVFRQIGVGANDFTKVFARPGYSLQEAYDWASQQR